jgi:hypothetical protein
MQTFCTSIYRGVRSSYRLALIPLPVANQEARLHFFLSIPFSFIFSSTFFISSLYFSLTIFYISSFTHIFLSFLFFISNILFVLISFFLSSFSFQMRHIMVIFNCITVASRAEWRRENVLTQFLDDTFFETQPGCLHSCPRFLIYLQANFEILT